MKSKKQVEVLLYLLDHDPHIKEIIKCFREWQENEPNLETFQKLFSEFRAADEVGDEYVLTWIVKKMQMLAWYVDRDDVMNEMQGINYLTYDDLIKKGQIFNDMDWARRSE